ncbi:GNAT family N-acetyltransferase [Nitrospira sp. T9]
MALKIRTIRDLKELDDIKPIWENLQNSIKGPSVFQSWFWNRTWCDEVLRHQKHAHLDVRIAEEANGNVVAIIPTFIDRLAVPGIATLQFLGHRMSIYNGILLSEPDNLELAVHVTESLIRSLGHATIIHLRHMGQEATFTKALLQKNWASLQCPRLILQRDPKITDQSMRLGPSRRKAFRTAQNRLKKEYVLEYGIVNPAHPGSAVDELISLHLRRFQSKEQASLLQGANQSFLRRAIQCNSAGDQFEIVQLRANGSTIAAVLMLRNAKTYIFLQAGFDPAFSRYSPMRLLLTETMRRAFDDLGCEYYDLGDGYAMYKYDWSPTAELNYFCCHGNSPFYANIVALAARYAFQRKTLWRLPQKGLELIPSLQS